MPKTLDRKRVEQAMRDAEQALKFGHPDTRAGRFNPNIGQSPQPNPPSKSLKTS
jgi:hypothetical protein